MSYPSETYRPSLALLTDLYQLTMAYAYWKSGRANDQAVFNLFFRSNPFEGGYTIACGLAHVIDFLEHLHFEESDLRYLANLRGNDHQPLFEPCFLEYLAGWRFTCDIDAIPEGTVVFPYEPLIRVRGPLVECQLLETPLLNLINFQSLIATKAARICQAARGEPVLEFGLRRAQGIDGGLAASRAAYIGGCAATSNVLAGKLLGIPVRGTHAHSWIMAFESELEAFLAYAEALPNNCVFLVDTYETLEGVRHAAQAGRRLRERGHEMIGIRLDSGDLAYLSIEARRILDAAGFEKATIIASNDLDEHIISSLKDQGATIDAWGVGTRLCTGFDQPALGGVYKLAAIRRGEQPWQYRVKLSEQAAKISTPGIHQVRRFVRNGQFIADMVYDETLAPRTADGLYVIVDPLDLTRRKRLPTTMPSEELLLPVFRGGRLVYRTTTLSEIRTRVQQQLGCLHPGIRRFVNPHQYPVGLELGLHELKTRLILEAREAAATAKP